MLDNYLNYLNEAVFNNCKRLQNKILRTKVEIKKSLENLVACEKQYGSRVQKSNPDHKEYLKGKLTNCIRVTKKDLLKERNQLEILKQKYKAQCS